MSRTSFGYTQAVRTPDISVLHCTCADLFDH